MRRALRIIVPSALLLCVAASAAFAQAPGQSPVARAGTLVVTRDEVVREVLIRRRGGDGTVILQTSTVDGLEVVARELLDRKLLAAEARARGIHAERGVVEMTNAAVDGVLSEILVTREIGALNLDDAHARAFYQAHGADFRTGVRRKARHIVVKTRDEANAALAAVRGGAPFAAYAAAHNVDLTKSNGGDLGWVTPHTMVRAFDEALGALKVGEISAVVQTSLGYHVITVEAIDEGTLPAFELVKDNVLEAMRRDVVERLERTLRERNAPTVNRNALAELLR